MSESNDENRKEFVSTSSCLICFHPGRGSLCAAHESLWWESSERKFRVSAMNFKAPQFRTALMDFVNRIWAEEINAGRPPWKKVTK